MSQRTIVVTGSASGMGAATVARLTADGHRVIGVDQRDADVIADLSTSEGRTAAIAAVADRAEGSLEGVVTWAGVAGLGSVPADLLVSVNFFGTVALLDGLRPLLAAGDAPAAVAISSNSTVCQPGIPFDVVDACLGGDEDAAKKLAVTASSLGAYPASKLAVARWVRRTAPTAEWAGSGIVLNVVAPGVVETPMLQATRDDDILGQFIDAFPVPVGRPADPSELAGVVSFLLGPDARFLCGSFLVADGGTDALLRPDDAPVTMDQFPPGYMD